MKKFFLFSLGSSVSLLWLGLFLSYENLPQPKELDIYGHMARGGFPLTAFYYPYPPMGSGMLAEDWRMFLVDYVILYILSLVLYVVFRNRINIKHATLLFYSSVVLTVFGLIYLLWRFD